MARFDIGGHLFQHGCMSNHIVSRREALAGMAAAASLPALPAFAKGTTSPQAMLDALQRAMQVAESKFAQAHKTQRVHEVLKRLTPRELEICHWMVRGYSNQQIAAVDGAAAATIKLHRARVMEKMQVHSLPELLDLLGGVPLPTPAPTLSGVSAPASTITASEARGPD